MQSYYVDNPLGSITITNSEKHDIQDLEVAAFITPADSALRNYASFIRQSCRESTIPAYSEPMQFAVQVFHALGEIGCLYQVDPTLPFTEVQENLMVVDSISLPRNILKNITGDCDDLTALYCSLLETVGINTAFITIPGHIYAAFNTKVPARDFGKIHPDRKMTISIDGELWVPVEITMIGKTGFLEAWRTGVEEWTRYDNEVSVRAFYKTRDSQAETAFNKVISMDSEFTGARINLGKLQFLQENYTGAVKSYETVFKKLEAKNRAESSTALKVLINLARASYRMEKFDEADSYFSKAKNIDPAKTEEYAYLASAEGSGTGRAAEEPVMKEAIIFVEEE